MRCWSHHTPNYSPLTLAACTMLRSSRNIVQKITYKHPHLSQHFPFHTSLNSFIRVSHAGYLLPSKFYASNSSSLLGQSSLCLASSHSSCTPWELPTAGRSQSPLRVRVCLTTLPTLFPGTHTFIEINSECNQNVIYMELFYSASWSIKVQKYSDLNHLWLPPTL